MADRPIPRVLLSNRFTRCPAHHLHGLQIKLCMYALVVLLNLNIVMASYAGDDLGYTSSLKALLGTDKACKSFLCGESLQPAVS